MLNFENVEVVHYNASENWIVDDREKSIIIFGLDGRPISVENVIFYDPLRGFIQTQDKLYVPYLNIKEEPNTNADQS